ncbi:hypothetical protein P171DRAFT_407382 [Karstenula rhodostoma CBS 690.94]|uniref:3CxxC-type domain-containing protein n=1 Tax=Karstenula rhodostoma CBS 690.94 TaxID=1392251 RepID=A0A9P4UH84_9PLEO|nr:hypothetical protein P171DRAFT_407382 [Karstenula rhodostoma CBS 690.94]
MPPKKKNTKIPPKQPEVVPKWLMHPELHGDVSRLLAEEDIHMSFHNVDSDTECMEDWDTNIVGRFKCQDKTCKSRSWVSGKVAITIRLYPGERYNARVYHQGCEKCDSISVPRLDDTYAERVANRLKIWHGVEVEAPAYERRTEKPHHSQLCEGCKAGHCRSKSIY